jgi:hypothetical protein
MMSKRIVTIVVLQLLFVQLAAVCQTTDEKDEWPCKTLPNRLLNDKGKPVWLSPEQLENRAILKPESSVPGTGCIWRDIIITVDVIISEEGNVICTRVKKGKVHPLYLGAAEKAAGKWTFSPIIDGAKPVAVRGRLKFFLEQNSGLGGSSGKRPPMIN